MKKLLTLLAAATISSAAMAEVSFEGYTVNPAEGEVTELNEILVTFPHLFDIDINNNDITITHNGTPLERNIPDPEDENILKVTLNQPATEGGTYVLTIPAESICGYADASYADLADLPSTITLTWTIAEGDNFFAYTVNPAEGEVTELSEILVTFPNIYEVDLNNNDITITHNGTPLERSVTDPDPGDALKITLNETATAVGTYVLTIPAESISGYTDASYAESSDLPSDITLTWTIAGAPDKLDFSVTTDPAADELVKELESLVVNFTNLGKVTIAANAPTVTVNGTPADVTVTTEANTVLLTFANKVEKGDIKVVFDANTVTGTKNGLTAANSEPITIEYTVAGAVVYDLTAVMANPKPNSDGEVSAERQLDNFIISSDVAGLVAANNDVENASITDEAGLYSAKVHLKKGFGVNQNYSYFSIAVPEPRYNGKYTITIDKGAFGDANWAKNPEVGRSNDKIVLTFTLVDGQDYNPNNISANVTPSGDRKYDSFDKIATITLTFDEEMTAEENAAGTLTFGDDFNATQTKAFTKTENGFSVTFDAPKDSDGIGEYTFTVPEGVFKAANGEGNRAISTVYTVVKKVQNDIEATVTPAGDQEFDSFEKIATITVKFDQEMTPEEGASAALYRDEETSPIQVKEFTKTADGFSVTFDTPESENTTTVYTFSVLAGEFKNAAGAGNKAISVVYTVKKDTGVVSIITEGADANVYTIDGRRLNSARNLTPGVYVINGKKVLVK